MIKIFILLSSFAVMASATNILTLATSYLFAKYQAPTKVKVLENNITAEKYVLEFTGMVRQFEGYAAEEYTVTTSDGYILALHRISSSPLSPKKDVKPVVYLQHGLYGSSDMWILGGPKNSLAFQLADAGYDVWLGNSRGNFYSRSHITYSADKDYTKFWDFSFEEMGTKDLTASIDFILSKTNQKKLTYIGYSMGTTMSYVLLSLKPEYNEKINLLVSMAPVAYFTQPPYKLLKTSLSLLLLFAKLGNLYEILPLSTETGRYAAEHCHATKAIICRNLLKLISDVDHVNDSFWAALSTHMPAGTSYRTVEHIQQISRSGKFQRFNYGCNLLWCNNKKIYQQNEPPEYDLSLIKVPNLIVWAKDDAFIKHEDVTFLMSKLNHVVASIQVSADKFNHLDFITSSELKSLVNDKVVKNMNSILSSNSS